MKRKVSYRKSMLPLLSSMIVLNNHMKRVNKEYLQDYFITHNGYIVKYTGKNYFHRKVDTLFMEFVAKKWKVADLPAKYHYHYSYGSE